MREARRANERTSATHRWREATTGVRQWSERGAIGGGQSQAAAARGQTGERTIGGRRANERERAKVMAPTGERVAREPSRRRGGGRERRAMARLQRRRQAAPRGQAWDDDDDDETHDALGLTRSAPARAHHRLEHVLELVAHAVAREHRGCLRRQDDDRDGRAARREGMTREADRARATPRHQPSSRSRATRVAATGDARARVVVATIERVRGGAAAHKSERRESSGSVRERNAAVRSRARREEEFARRRSTRAARVSITATMPRRSATRSTKGQRDAPRETSRRRRAT